MFTEYISHHDQLQHVQLERGFVTFHTNNIRAWCNFLMTALGPKLFLVTNNKQTN